LADIDELRSRIAEADRRLMDALAERDSVAREIGRYKLSLELPIRNTEVEGEVMERFEDLGRERGIDPRTARDLATVAIKDAVEVQSWIMMPLETRRMLVIGGAGKMGSWLSRYFLARGHDVRILDPKKDEDLQRAASLEEGVAWADIVVVATPIAITRDVLDDVISLEPRGLVFDIASIKGPVIDLLRKGAVQGVTICSVHPMFGPDAPSLYDRNVLMCHCGSDRAVREAMELFEGTGAMILRVGVDEHDELVSFVLGLSHAVSLAFFRTLSDSGFDFQTLERAGSTTFRKQMSTSRDVAFENPELYYDIQNQNPMAGRALALLEAAVADIRRSAVEGDKTGFIEIMEKGRRYFGGIE